MKIERKDMRPRLGRGWFDPKLLAMTIQEQLERRVGEVVRRVVAELPQDLRALAERVPVYCEENLPTFDKKVCITCIHEFGHDLGLDESGLESRVLL